MSQKTEGFRGRHPVCPAGVGSPCPSLDALSGSCHVVSCAATRWQLTPSQVDQVLQPGCGLQVGLATLCPDPSSPATTATRFVTEPETEVPYRVRIAGCESGNIQPEAMLLDDIERVFDGEEHRCVLIPSTTCTLHSNSGFTFAYNFGMGFHLFSPLEYS